MKGSGCEIGDRRSRPLRAEAEHLSHPRFAQAPICRSGCFIASIRTTARPIASSRAMGGRDGARRYRGPRRGCGRMSPRATLRTRPILRDGQRHRRRARWDYSRPGPSSPISRDLPVPDRSMDVVLNINVLEHVADPLAGAARVSPGTAPGRDACFSSRPNPGSCTRRPTTTIDSRVTGSSISSRKVGFTSLTVEPVGGTFWNLGSRSLYILTHFEGKRFPVAVLLAPIFGFLIPFVVLLPGQARSSPLGHPRLQGDRPQDTGMTPTLEPISKILPSPESDSRPAGGVALARRSSAMAALGRLASGPILCLWLGPDY